jgi:hypothetical protein
MSGVMLACGVIAMLWVEDPDEADDSPIMPFATHRHITVYDRMVVGTDGSPASRYAVAHASGRRLRLPRSRKKAALVHRKSYKERRPHDRRCKPR